MIVLLALACLEDRGSPNVGSCADYPEGTYDYGEIGIGSCLAGPLSMEWLERDDGGLSLAVTNANPYLDFTGGSVSSYDITALLVQAQAGDGTALTKDVATSSLDMPNFPSYAAYVPDRELLLVPNRLTSDSRTRVGFDDVYFVDTTDPASLAFANVGPEGADHIELMSDPALVAYDAVSQYAFVANLTSHNLSVLDMAADTIEIIDARESAGSTLPRFFDADSSGSRAARTDFQVINHELLENEAFTLAYVDGLYRLWVPTAEGIYRVESAGDEDWTESAFGLELSLEDDGNAVSFDDPGFGQLVVDDTIYTRMLWADGGSLRGALSDSHLGDWATLGDDVLSAREGETLGGPHEVVSETVNYLFFDTESGIELATTTAGTTIPTTADYRREGLLLEGDYADPYVFFDGQADVWRMVFSTSTGIGLAESDDLLSWTTDDEDIASGSAPVVAYSNFEFRMWTLHDDGIHVATSPDGLRWDEGGLVHVPDGDFAGGPALQVSTEREWSLSSDVRGPMTTSGDSGDTLVAAVSVEAFMSLQVSSGWSIAGEQGGDGVNGVQADSWVDDRIYSTLTDANLTTSIGVSDHNGGQPSRPLTVFEGQDGSFDAEGVGDAVVFENDGELVMLYAGEADRVVAIGRATSADGGDTWDSDHSIAFDVGEEWDSVSVRPGSVVVHDDGTYSLWYTGFDGSRSRVGLATSTDTLTWTRVEAAENPWWFAGGTAGTFDDSAVREPFVLETDSGTHLWYSAFDGDIWRIGHAELVDGAFVRSIGRDDQPRPVLSGINGSFDGLGAWRPVVVDNGDGSFELFYTGTDALVPRVGHAVALSADRVYRDPLRPTAGDTLVFKTESGDDGSEEAIPLERTLDSFSTSGLALSYLHIDTDRGFLYAASKVSPYIYVVDIREDFAGDNVLDLEAILVANTDIGSRAFRGMVAPSGSRWLYAVNNAPESVMLFDLDLVVDDDRAEVHFDAVGGYLATPRGLEADEGSRSQASIGPAQLVLNGDLLYVSNFNANSVSVYDLRLGAYGERIDDVEMLGENPHALALSPDGTLLAVAEYTGEVEDIRASSSLAIIDVDPDSPTYLQVLARMVNQ
jgi:hypothetical protein